MLVCELQDSTHLKTIYITVQLYWCNSWAIVAPFSIFMKFWTVHQTKIAFFYRLFFCSFLVFSRLVIFMEIQVKIVKINTTFNNIAWRAPFDNNLNISTHAHFWRKTIANMPNMKYILRFKNELFCFSGIVSLNCCKVLCLEAKKSCQQNVAKSFLNQTGHWSLKMVDQNVNQSLINYEVIKMSTMNHP